MSGTTHAALQRLAQAALVVATAVFLWTMVAAVRITPTSPISASPRGETAAEPSALRASANPSDIERAVNHDMFNALRLAPARRYTLGAESPSPSPDVYDADDQTEMPLELPSVQGTAVNALGEGFAMCSLPGAPAVVVRSGDTIGEFTVISIERERVVFGDAAGRRHPVAANASPVGDDR